MPAGAEAVVPPNCCSFSTTSPSCFLRLYLSSNQVPTHPPPPRPLPSRRLPQIWSNFVSKATGQLSIITYALNAAGAAARIFTSIQEQAGAAMLRGAMISEWRQGRVGRTASAGRQQGCWMHSCEAVAGLTTTPSADTHVHPTPPPSGTLLNAILALQIVWYGRGGKKQKKGGSKRSSKSKAA